MIKRVKIENSRGNSLTMTLTNPVDCGIYVAKIDGLGPPKATIAMNDYCSIDGSKFSMARAETRNITFNLGFLPCPSIEESRHRSYEYFPIKEKIKITVETDIRTTCTTGYIESNEPDIFSREEETKISVLCPDPYFHAERDQYTSFYGSMGLFEFPFSNEIDGPGIRFGEFYARNGATIIYDGDVSTGVTIDVEAIGETGNIHIHNMSDNETFIVSSELVECLTGTPIQAGDEIIACTERGNKSCFLARNGVYINIISCVDRTSKWLTIHRGSNKFVVSCDGGEDTAHITVSNKILYFGV